MTDEQFEEFIKYGLPTIRDKIRIELRRRNISRISVEDVEGQVVARLFRIHLKGELELKPVYGLISKIISGVIVDQLRVKSSNMFDHQESLSKFGDFGTTVNPVKKSLRKERQEIVRQFVAQLDRRKRQIVEMYFYQSISQQEIARRLNISYPALRQILARVGRELQSTMKNRGFRESFFQR